MRGSPARRFEDIVDDLSVDGPVRVLHRFDGATFEDGVADDLYRHEPLRGGCRDPLALNLAESPSCQSKNVAENLARTFATKIA